MKKLIFILCILVSLTLTSCSDIYAQSVTLTNNKVEKDAESLVPHMIWFYKHNIGVGRTELTLEELDNAIRDAISKQIQEAAESSVQR